MTDLVQAGDLLVQAMGYWPSFHDAEVVTLVRTSASVTVTIHLFEMTDQTDAAGHFVLRKHHLVELCMVGVHADTLPRNYPGDVLNGLGFRREDPYVAVDFESHTDSGGAVLCEEVLLKRVVPYDKASPSQG